MQWQCLTFEQLTTHQLYELLKLRVDVFVVEQDCPYPELDNKDQLPHTRHLLGYQQGKLAAYLRLLAPGSTYPNASIGRVLTAEFARGNGAGHALLKEGLAHAERLWPDHSLDIGAQSHLQPYYGRYGFEPISEEYLEDGIPHIDMRLRKGKVLG
ncbi:GNAT family N-acetyltransferase [Photobacterium atrarenae]|uniref:GNAT family N-acetyltransferase n=1 Tax=Photobacterium atrarenae TaxID=865757 RepID=A0ABY5GE58_9GAMM|nr:GNAT family N-acetyltransferase [Photobacterium atrarenae]UTV27481.1 GNAT family N-acetyltransferase [Photobacterium atrarenae]